jgi:geranylgeranyl diphosphate synthase type II
LRKKVRRRKNDLSRFRETRGLINTALRNCLNGLKGPGTLRRAMGYVVLSGGKRLRPLLTMESSRALNGNPGKALPFACAIELIHNFSLVHDDLPAMDDDDMRRGKPACHKKFGEDMAILAGDALLNLAFGILSRCKNTNSLKVIALISGAVGVESMIGGQVLDLKYKSRFTHRPGAYGIPPYAPGRCVKRPINYKIDGMKTASLMAVSCEVGGLAANAGRGDIKKLHAFGRNLGLAFQIADDITDSRYNKAALEKMKTEARSFISKGKENIAPFGKKADGLRHIADSVANKVK